MPHLYYDVFPLWISFMHAFIWVPVVVFFDNHLCSINNIFGLKQHMCAYNITSWLIVKLKWLNSSQRYRKSLIPSKLHWGVVFCCIAVRMSWRDERMESVRSCFSSHSAERNICTRIHLHAIICAQHLRLSVSEHKETNLLIRHHIQMPKLLFHLNSAPPYTYPYSGSDVESVCESQILIAHGLGRGFSQITSNGSWKHTHTHTHTHTHAHSWTSRLCE